MSPFQSPLQCSHSSRTDFHPIEIFGLYNATKLKGISCSSLLALWSCLILSCVSPAACWTCAIHCELQQKSSSPLFDYINSLWWVELSAWRVEWALGCVQGVEGSGEKQGKGGIRRWGSVSAGLQPLNPCVVTALQPGTAVLGAVRAAPGSCW